ncbi:MAG: PKD domain-containing protein, partial [Candidatus Odinarchaeota archaeon]
MEYFYNFGDGYETDWTVLSNVVHKYRSLGQFKITLQVRDDLDGISEEAAVFINVTEKVNEPPKVRITYPLDDDSVAGELTIQGYAEDP